MKRQVRAKSRGLSRRRERPLPRTMSRLSCPSNEAGDPGCLLALAASSLSLTPDSENSSNSPQRISNQDPPTERRRSKPPCPRPLRVDSQNGVNRGRLQSRPDDSFTPCALSAPAWLGRRVISETARNLVRTPGLGCARYSFDTVLLSWFDTQMLAPSKATPRGPPPTPKVPRIVPSRARSLVTLSPP